MILILQVQRLFFPLVLLFLPLACSQLKKKKKKSQAIIETKDFRYFLIFVYASIKLREGLFVVTLLEARLHRRGIIKSLVKVILPPNSFSKTWGFIKSILQQSKSTRMTWTWDLILMCYFVGFGESSGVEGKGFPLRMKYFP